MNAAFIDLVLVLCLASPCVLSGDVLQVPTPDVHSLAGPERYPGRSCRGIRVVFVPMARGA